MPRAPGSKGRDGDWGYASASFRRALSDANPPIGVRDPRHRSFSRTGAPATSPSRQPTSDVDHGSNAYEETSPLELENHARTNDADDFQCRNLDGSSARLAQANRHEEQEAFDQRTSEMSESLAEPLPPLNGGRSVAKPQCDCEFQALCEGRLLLDGHECRFPEYLPVPTEPDKTIEIAESEQFRLRAYIEQARGRGHLGRDIIERMILGFNDAEREWQSLLRNIPAQVLADQDAQSLYFGHLLQRQTQLLDTWQITAQMEDSRWESLGMINEEDMMDLGQ